MAPQIWESPRKPPQAKAPPVPPQSAIQEPPPPDPPQVKPKPPEKTKKKAPQAVPVAPQIDQDDRKSTPILVEPFDTND